MSQATHCGQLRGPVMSPHSLSVHESGTIAPGGTNELALRTVPEGSQHNVNYAYNVN